MNSKGVVHIVDPGSGSIEDKAELFAALDLEPRVYRSPLEFLRGFTHAKPCCLISAMRQPELPGLELLAQVQKQPIPPPVIIMTAYGDVQTAVQAMKLGAAEFLEIPVHDEVLLGVVQNWIRIDRVRRGKANKCAAVREKLAKLSAREREVLAGVLGGQSNKEMAAKLAHQRQVHRGLPRQADGKDGGRLYSGACARGPVLPAFQLQPIGLRLSVHWLGLLRQRPRKQRNVWSHS